MVHLLQRVEISIASLLAALSLKAVFHFVRCLAPVQTSLSPVWSAPSLSSVLAVEVTFVCLNSCLQGLPWSMH